MSLEKRNRSGYTPIFIAVINGNSELVKLLIEKGSYLAALDYNNKNILHYALEGTSTEIIMHLLIYPQL